MAEFTELMKEFLELLEKGSALLPDKTKEKYISLIDTIKSCCNLSTPVREFLTKVVGYLFDPQKGYASLVNEISDLLSVRNWISDLKASTIPEDIQQDIDEMEAYLDKVEELNIKIEKEVGELIETVDYFVKENLEMGSKEFKEIKQKQNRLERDCNICKEYLTKAHEAFNNLELKVPKKKDFYSRATFVTGTVAFIAGGALTIMVAIKAAVGLGTAAGITCTKTSIKSAVACGVGTVGGLVAYTRLSRIGDKYAELLKDSAVMKKKLTELSIQLTKIKANLKYLEDEMELLKVKDEEAAEIPAAEIPAAEIPAAEIPAAEIPAAEIPAAEIPAAKTVAGETSDTLLCYIIRQLKAIFQRTIEMISGN